MHEWLIEGFRHDQEANLEWAAWLKIEASAEDLAEVNGHGPWLDFPHGPERAKNVFLHILYAGRNWLERSGRTVLFSGADPAVWVSELDDAWIDEIPRRTMEERIDFRNSAGIPGQLTFGEIARHVLEHAIYHRGQLREICDGPNVPQTG